MNNKELIRKVKFTLFSISAGLIEIGLFTLLDNITNLNYWPKYLIALVASVIWNFTLNREFTFKSSNNIPIAMFKVFIFYFIEHQRKDNGHGVGKDQGEYAHL